MPTLRTSNPGTPGPEVQHLCPGTPGSRCSSASNQPVCDEGRFVVAHAGLVDASKSGGATRDTAAIFHWCFLRYSCDSCDSSVPTITSSTHSLDRTDSFACSTPYHTIPYLRRPPPKHPILLRLAEPGPARYKAPLYVAAFVSGNPLEQSSWAGIVWIGRRTYIHISRLFCGHGTARHTSPLLHGHTKISLSLSLSLSLLRSSYANR
jgi:hypothetical protein